MKLDVFKFKSMRDLLQAAYRTPGINRRRALTLPAIASRLGYTSPRTVAMVLKGQRTPSSELVNRVARDLHLGVRERTYVEALVDLEKRRRDGVGANEAVKAIEAMRSVAGQPIEMDLASFSYIANWYFLVIKQLIQQGIPADAEALFPRLGNKVSRSRIKSAIETMTNLGILVSNERGELVVAQVNLTTLNDIPSAAIKSHHEQMLQRAAEALNNQSVLEREFRAATFSFDPSQTTAAKNEIRRFQAEFEQRFGGASSKTIYQMNIHFFRQTETPNLGPNKI